MQLLPLASSLSPTSSYRDLELESSIGVPRPSTKPIKTTILSLVSAFVFVVIYFYVRFTSSNDQICESDLKVLPKAVIPPLFPVSNTDSQCASHVNNIMIKETEDRLVDSCYNIMPSFPQLGGEGCQCPCAEPESKNISLQTSFGFLDIPDKFLEDIKIIVRILQAHGRLDTELRGTYYDAETDTHFNKLHVPLLHHCCISPREAMTIGEATRNLTWGSLEASFEQLNCGRASEGQTYIYLSLDSDSSSRLSSVVDDLHSYLQSKGVAERIIRKESHFQMRIATVPADFPCNHALLTLRAQMPEDIFSRHLIRMKYLALWNGGKATFAI